MDELTVENLNRLSRTDLEFELLMRGLVSASDASTEALRSQLEEQLLIESID